MSLTALLFDVDGTLADTEDVHRQAFNTAFADAGLDWVWDRALYKRLLAVTGGKERIRHYLETVNTAFDPPADLAGFIAGLHAAKTEIYTRTLAEGGVPLRPGVRRLLEEARAEGLRLGIATTTTPDNVFALLEHSLAPDAAGWFDVIAAGGVVPAKKPAPDIYNYALDAMGLGHERCIAFEDSENGLRSARAVGLPTLITVNPYTDDHDFTGAALVVDQLGGPDAPFSVIAGDAGDSRWVDVALLRRLHGAAG